MSAPLGPSVRIEKRENRAHSKTMSSLNQSHILAMPGAHSSADWLSRSCAEALGLAETRRPRALEVNQWSEEKSDQYAHLAVNDASEVPNESATVVSDTSDRSNNLSS